MMDEWMNKWMDDGQIDSGWMDGWWMMDGWMGGWIGRQMDE